MAAKDVKFSTDARDRMLRGVDILASTGRPVPLKAGDEIQIGKSVLRFGERQQRK